MRRRIAVAVIVLGMAIGGMAIATALSQRSAPPKRLQGVHSWAFAIGEGAAARDLSRYDLVVVDGQETTARRVRELHRTGAVVLGYLSVGTIERGRPWFAAAAPYRRELWEDWGEWYADVSAPGFQKLIAQKVAPAMLVKGFDGLFLDNVDMIETHRGQTAGMRKLVAALAKKVHARKGYLFAQNGEATIGPMLRYLDGWNREDVTGTYDFDTSRYVTQSAADIQAAQAALRRIKKAGLLVTATDYLPADDTAGAAQATANACAAGALPYLSDIELRRVAATPFRCR
jgi:polysaccharide biosynthesis protein PelA